MPNDKEKFETCAYVWLCICLIIVISTYPFGCSDIFGGGCIHADKVELTIVTNKCNNNNNRWQIDTCEVKGQYFHNGAYGTCEITKYDKGDDCCKQNNYYYPVKSNHTMMLDTEDFNCYSLKSYEDLSIVGFTFTLMIAIILIMLCIVSCSDCWSDCMNWLFKEHSTNDANTNFQEMTFSGSSRESTYTPLQLNKTSKIPIAVVATQV